MIHLDALGRTLPGRVPMPFRDIGVTTWYHDDFAGFYVYHLKDGSTVVSPRDLGSPKMLKGDPDPSVTLLNVSIFCQPLACVEYTR